MRKKKTMISKNVKEKKFQGQVEGIVGNCDDCWGWNLITKGIMDSFPAKKREQDGCRIKRYADILNFILR